MISSAIPDQPRNEINDRDDPLVCCDACDTDTTNARTCQSCGREFCPKCYDRHVATCGDEE